MRDFQIMKFAGQEKNISEDKFTINPLHTKYKLRKLKKNTQKNYIKQFQTKIHLESNSNQIQSKDYKHWAFSSLRSFLTCTVDRFGAEFERINTIVI